MNEMQIPEMPAEIARDEQLARLIAYPSMVTGGKVNSSAFSLVVLKSGTVENYVSVERSTYRIPRKEYYSFSPRKDGDNWIGYASLAVEDVLQTAAGNITTSVMAHPSKRNRYHAGIHYNNFVLELGDSIDPDYQEVTEMLAERCAFISF